MCWTGENIPQIAEKDIKVIKAVHYDRIKGIITSAYCNFHYKISSTYSNMQLGIKERVDGTISISTGFHSYNPNKITFKKTFGVTEIRSKAFYLDHFCVSFICKLNCTIPKGATYYENKYGEIVSNKLRVDSLESIK